MIREASPPPPAPGPRRRGGALAVVVRDSQAAAPEAEERYLRALAGLIARDMLAEEAAAASRISGFSGLTP